MRISDWSSDVCSSDLKRACQLNGIDKPTREIGLSVLKNAGRIDIAKNGAVSVLGATSTAVLEVTADIFADAGPSKDEEAVLELSEKVAEKPLGRKEATEFVSDLYGIATPKASSLIDLCKSTAIIDEETDRDRTILFNSNTFRDGQYAKKTLLVLEALTPDEKARLSEVQEKLRRNGALYEDRKSVVWGKRVSVRVDLGGRRLIKKKKKKKIKKHTKY